MAPTTYLDEILVAHRARAAADRRPLERVIADARATSATEPPRDFASALKSGGLAVVAEVKRRSPSKGPLNPDLDAAQLAATYARGGAAALSVLTDRDFFGGSPTDLRRARAAVDLPVLRKDFTVSLSDVADARAIGADAVLLIVAALADAELRDFHELATDLGLSVLVEAHDEEEVERAIDANASIIGVNQRDLVTFEVDTDRAVRVAAAIPDGVTKVAESGIRGAADVAALAAAGYDAVLVGEHLVTSGDAARSLQELVGACS